MRFSSWFFLSCLLVVAGGTVLADEYADRVKLLGTWESTDSSASGDRWLFEGQEENLHVVHSKGAQKMADYACKATGAECSTKVDGKSAKISMYFNGPALVVLETRGSDVTKERFSTMGDDEMQLEVMPISGKGKAETLHFKRSKETSQR